jgi:photosystem II stability/assembly factor-like uncharacterized protein
MDRTNPNVIIAGGVSGGIWKSADGGMTWRLKTPATDDLAVSWLLQDPRTGHEHEWYYTTGELIGNSAGYPSSSFTGSGIFKSSDFGETWQLLPVTADPNMTQYDSAFDYVFRMDISPVTGSMFVASAGFGLFRSTDGGQTFDRVLGGTNQHRYVDVCVSTDGLLLATLSQRVFSTTGMTDQPGVYLSEDDGATWQNITPNTYPDQHWRSFPAFAPSDPSLAYVMTFTGKTIDGGTNYYDVPDDVRMHKLVFDRGTSTATWSDHSDNLPPSVFPDEYFTAQTGYNMIMAVSPEDPNFVVYGLSRLYRTTSGFASPHTSRDVIGNFNSANFHVDQHAVFFHWQRPEEVWIGNDGGIQKTSDIQASSVRWTSLNRGYNVTQFYHAAISSNSGDTRVMGGTQDNGSPFMIWDADKGSLGDVSGGDGSFSAFTQTHMFTSSQNGRILRFGYRQDPSVDMLLPSNSDVAYCFPTSARDQSFINPFVIDPSDEAIMYYPDGRVFWRNTDVTAAPSPQTGVVEGWSRMTSLAIRSGTTITALAVSQNPAHRLYLGGSGNNQLPTIYTLDDAHTASTGMRNVSLSEATPGSYISDLAINPEDGNEVLAVLSNYNIVGLFHSVDGGETWEAVEGNLEGTNDDPGPALRSAAILPESGQTTYYLGTSIGLFSTQTLAGSQTQWQQVAPQVIGNTIVAKVLARPSDGVVVAATHGRGFFAKAPGKSKRQVLPWVSNRDGQFRSELAIYNLSQQRETILLTARRADGSSEVVSRSIPGKGFLNEAADALFPNLGSGPGYAVTIEGFVGELESGWITNNLVAASGNSPSRGVGVTVPEGETASERAGQRLLFSFLPLSNGFIAAPVLVNLEEEPQDIHLQFYDATGSLVAEETLLGVMPFTPVAAVANEWVEPSAGDVSLVATSEGMMTGASFVFSTTFNEPAIGNASALPLEESETFATYMLPWISNNAGSFSSTIILNNYGSQDVEMLLTARRADGSKETAARVVPARGFLQENAATLFPALGSGSGYAVEVFAGVSHIHGGWITNSLKSVSGASPSMGNAVWVPSGSETTDRMGDTLFFGRMPSGSAILSAPVIVNVGNTTADVVLEFFNAEGQLLKTDTTTLLGLEKMTPFAALVSDLLPSETQTVMVVARAEGGRLTGASFVFDLTYIEPAIGNAVALPYTP